MSRKLWIAILLALALSLALALVAQAQEPRPTVISREAEAAGAEEEAAEVYRTIRGAVFRDANNDGRCGGEGEGALAGVPVRFVSEGGLQVYLQSGGDGTFGLAAAGAGTWYVTAQPTAEQGVVTSADTRTVVVTDEAPVVLAVDFCVGTARPGRVVLPESGAPAVPAFWATVLVGFGLLGLGATLHLRRER